LALSLKRIKESIGFDPRKTKKPFPVFGMGFSMVAHLKYPLHIAIVNGLTK
jgi:hypothetical protein